MAEINEAILRITELLQKLDTPLHIRYFNFILPEEPGMQCFDLTIATLKKIFGTQTTVFTKRYQCLQLLKSEADDIISYGGKVNCACEAFEFEKLTIDQFKCLIFVCGLKAPRYAYICARLLSRIETETVEAPVKLENLIEEYQRLVNLKADTTLIEQPSSSKQTVYTVRDKDTSKNHSAAGKSPRTPCWQCSQMHYVCDCPFSSHQCKTCNHVGHKEGYCSCISNKRKFIPISVNGVKSKLQLDTASNITVISKQIWNNLGKPAINNPTIEAVNASGQPLKLIGEFQCEIQIKGKTYQGRCFVTMTPNLNLLGIDWIEMFGLWSVPIDSICNQVQMKSDQQIIEFRAKHADVFKDSLGHCNTISLVDAELTRLQSLGIIEPVDFSEWAAPIVAVRKPNGKVRICADYSTGLNEALEANHYPLPTLEEIFAQLNGSTVYNLKLMKNHQLLTINTHRGLFRFNRLAPGVKSAPGAFQPLVDRMIADIPGVRSFIDDVIVFGKDMKSHAASLNQLFQQFKEYGFHVKAEKCRFFQPTLRYLGHIVDNQGIHPDPENVKSIAAIPPPTNITELPSYLGAINCYGRFLKLISPTDSTPLSIFFDNFGLSDHLVPNATLNVNVPDPVQVEPVLEL
ncbi:uncharacterized protein K02A2.6-like [Sabethes cyaneus]|uniref:uncharacterized protein K02A2.6-like n=1 Tax=Sabethes cyaneus TaxID=53552 RepID=UPI00237D8344|nr:uncharacterized protein K02A2.6-like [Sabethes cyaneus]